MTQQLSLFGPAAAPVAPAVCPPPKATRSRRGQSPQAATEVLSEVQEGRFGVLDDGERVMTFTETDRVRKALDEDLVHHLIRAGLIEQHPRRDTLSCLHGAIRRPVTPLRLTKRGREQLARWTALHPLRRA